MSRHAPHLPVFPFPQNDFQPASRNRSPITDRWCPYPKPLWLGNLADLTGARQEIAKIHPGHQLLHRGIRWQAFNLNQVNLAQFVVGIGNPRLQTAVVSQHHQTFGVRIQPASGVYIRYPDVVGKRRSSVAA